MSESNFAFICGSILGLIAGVSLGCWMGGSVVTDFQAKAVEREAAEWVVDQQTGNTTFTWKDEHKSSNSK